MCWVFRFDIIVHILVSVQKDKINGGFDKFKHFLFFPISVNDISVYTRYIGFCGAQHTLNYADN
jgi:hypothetical protein